MSSPIPKMPFSDDTMVLLRERSQRDGVPMMVLVEQAVTAMLTGKAATVTVPREMTLADAAEVFLVHMDAGQADLIRDLCRDAGHEPSDYLLSYIHLARERGETAALIGEHVMAQHAPAAVTMPTGESICEYEGCRKAFIATRRGQKYCPDPEEGEGCGRKASLEELHRNRAARTRGADNRYAPPTKPLDVYRRAATTVE